MKLASKADVIVENYRPDVKTRLGIDYETSAKINPRIIYGSHLRLRPGRPLRRAAGLRPDRAGHGRADVDHRRARPGPDARRHPDRRSVRRACSARMGILLALLEREQSGKGQWVQSSLLQAQVFMLDFQAARWLMDKEVPGQAGNDHPTSIPTGVFKTTRRLHQHRRGRPAHVAARARRSVADPGFDNPDFDTAAGRSKHRKAVNAADREAHRKRYLCDNWIDRLNAAGIPCGEINTIDQVFASPQVQHLGLAQDMPSHERGPTRPSRSRSRSAARTASSSCRRR